MRSSAVEILLLTQDDCAYCEHARAVLDRVARDYSLIVTTQSLDSPMARDLAESAGMLFAPGVFVGGEAFTYGRLSERKLRRELDRRLSGSDRAVNL